MSSRLAAALLTGGMLCAVSTPAFAIEPEAVADALIAALTSGGGNTSITYDSASDVDGDVSIEGFKVTREGEAESVSFADVTIEAPTEGDSGIFDSPGITFSEGTVAGESSGTIESATLTEVTVLDPGEVEGDAPGKAVLFKTAEASGLTVKPKDQTGELTIDRIVMELGSFVDNIPQDNKGSVEGLNIPASFFDGGEVTPATIGYDGMALDITWDGSRDRDAKTITVRDLTLSIVEGGDLSVAGVMGNVPEPNALNDADAASRASEIELHALTVRYDDNSLAGRILEYLAKQQGITRAEYAQQMAAAMPFLLAALSNPDFQGKVAEAVGAFLQDPQSLTITIEPESPVSGAEIMNLAGTAPGTLPDRLKASVSANTPE